MLYLITADGIMYLMIILIIPIPRMKQERAGEGRANSSSGNGNGSNSTLQGNGAATPWQDLKYPIRWILASTH